MNSFYFLCQQTMIFFVPLMVVALGELFSERSGVLNIALEGIMVFGGFWGILFVSKFQASMPVWLCLRPLSSSPWRCGCCFHCCTHLHRSI